MFHSRIVLLELITVLTACLWGPASHAAGHPRIVSINVCTDQLLLAFADPDQIVGLSPYSRDAARSWAAATAARYPRLSGEAEDILVLKPDLVVAGRYTKRATRELLKSFDVRVAEFDAARSLEDAKAQMRRMGGLVGHPERAETEIGRLEAAVGRARAAASGLHGRVLPLSRRGWASGGDSLMTSLLAETGLLNAGGELGLKAGGFVSLEQIVHIRPDLLLVSSDKDFAEDQGQAFLFHPALEQLYPPSRRIVIPERLTVCGGPMLADALDRLIAELGRVSH